MKCLPPETLNPKSTLALMILLLGQDTKRTRRSGGKAKEGSTPELRSELRHVAKDGASFFRPPADPFEEPRTRRPTPGLLL